MANKHDITLARHVRGARILIAACCCASAASAFAAPEPAPASDGFFSAPTKPDEKRCVVVITYPSKRPDLAVIDAAPKGKCGPAIDAAVATALAQFLTEQIRIVPDAAIGQERPLGD